MTNVKLLVLQCPSAGGSNPVSAVLHAEASCLQGKPAQVGATSPSVDLYLPCTW